MRESFVRFVLVGRRRGNDPYIKHLSSLGLKISTIYVERSIVEGQSNTCITVPISRNAEFLDTAAVYAWVSSLINCERWGYDLDVNQFFSIACIPALTMIAAKGQWIKIFYIWSISAMALSPTRWNIGSMMPSMRVQKLPLPIVHSVTTRCVWVFALYLLTVKK